MSEDITEEEIAELVRGVDIAASAFMRGDIHEYLTYIKHADDYTLMAPFGGETHHGFDDSEEALAAFPKYFKNGETRLEVVQTYRSGDLVVLVAVEHQHGEVGGLPDQEWSLRVSLVFRRSGADWLLVHRHADPLVHDIGIERASVIARG